MLTFIIGLFSGFTLGVLSLGCLALIKGKPAILACENYNGGTVKRHH